jgi:hypothetical protein
MDFAQSFQPCQILYLEHERDRLYVEVVQIVAIRQMCWARPLMLVTSPALPPTTHSFTEVDELTLHDLRQAPDLLWPISLFQAALDSDVIALLSQLYSVQPQPEKAHLARQLLNVFIQQTWQAYPQAFQA